MRRPAELMLLAGLLVWYVVIYALEASDLYQMMNIVGPVVLMATLGWSCYRIVRQNPLTVWAPLFWFRVACAAYYGFGALVPHIANYETRQHIFGLYHFGDALNLKVNIIYCVGILCTLLFAHIFLFQDRRRRKSGDGDGDARGSSQTLFFAISFVLVGAGLRYGLVLPYEFGLTQTVVPGLLTTLSRMYYVGIYLLIVYGLKHIRMVLFTASVLVGIDILVSVASFAKAELLLILVVSFLGFISRGASKTKIMLGSACVLLAYFTFQPLVGYGRDQIATRYGEIRGAGLNERWEIVQRYLDGGRDTIVSTRQRGLSRLSYVNVAAFVVDRYDFGMPGDTLRNAAAVLVPRALWPDKPIITRLGVDLNVLVFGREGSSLGVGHFAEAYWNFGWWGIAPFMAFLALILSSFTRVSIRIMCQERWLFLPVVFIGVNMGIRVDGHFVPDILGPSWIAVCLGFTLMAIEPLFKISVRHRKPVWLARHRPADQ